MATLLSEHKEMIGWFESAVKSDLEGYELACIRDLPKCDGELQSFVVLSRFVGSEPDWKVNTHATHIGVLDGMLATLVWGHYDMNLADAINDFNERGW